MDSLTGESVVSKRGERRKLLIREERSVVYREYTK